MAEETDSIVSKEVSSISEDHRKIIFGCVQEGITHELPERLKLWEPVPNYDEIQPIAKRKAKIAQVCSYWYNKVKELQLDTLIVRSFAKRVIECYIDCYEDPLDDDDDPVCQYLWPAIKIILIWDYHLGMLPSKHIAKSIGHGQKCFDILIHEVLFSKQMWFLCYGRLCAQMFFTMLKKDINTQHKSGWLLRFSFSAEPTEKHYYYEKIFQQILERRLFDSDVVSELLSHGMRISNNDVFAAITCLPDTEYHILHSIVSHRDDNELEFEKVCTSLVKKREFINVKPNFAAIIACASSARTEMLDKLAMNLKAVCPQNLQLLVPTLSSKKCSKLFLHFWKIKDLERCDIVLDGANSLDKQITLQSFEKFTTFILDQQSGRLYEPLITHSSLDLNEVFKVVFNANKLKKIELYKFALLFVLNNGDIDLLSLAYTQGKKGTAVHGAVELCLSLKAESEVVDKTQLLSEACKRVIKQPKPKVTDSNNSTPYHLIAKQAGKSHVLTSELLCILDSFNFIDPTLKDKKNKTALTYAKSQGNNFSKENEKILSDIVDKWTRTRTTKSRKTPAVPNPNPKAYSPNTFGKRSKQNQPHNESCINVGDTTKPSSTESNINNNETRESSQITQFNPRIVECVGQNPIEHDKTNQTSSLKTDHLDGLHEHVSLEEATDTSCLKKVKAMQQCKSTGTSHKTMQPDIKESDRNPVNNNGQKTSRVNDSTIDQTLKVLAVDHDMENKSNSLENSNDLVQLETLEELLQKLMEKSSKYFTAADDVASNADNVSNDSESEDDDALSSDDDSDDEAIAESDPVVVDKPIDIGDDDQLINTSDNDDATSLKLNGQSENFTDIESSTGDFDSFPWEIYLAKQANDFLKSSKTSKRVKNDIVKKIRLIAMGNRSRVICHRLISPQDKLYETKLYRGARIIWCEAIQYSENEDLQFHYRDVVKIIWITLKHSKHQLSDVLQKVKIALEKSRNVNSTKQLKVVGDHSKTKPNSKNYRTPRVFTPVNHIETTENLERLHPLPNLFGGEFSIMQFHPLTELYFDALLNNDLSNRDFPICLSECEHEIIELPYRKEAIILCGRSGTGKTTTCIYRMWNEFQRFWSRHEKDSEDVMHQTFITKNPVLCYQVKKEFHKLMRSRQNFKNFKGAKLQKGGILSDYTDEMFPLFMTSRNFLLHLDSSLAGETFFPRNEQTQELAIWFKFNVYDYNDEIDPDILDNYEQLEPDNAEKTEGAKRCAIEISADYFCSEIWPNIISGHNHQHINLDPLLIWTEIQSFIKGSREAVKSDKGHLTEEEYIALGKHVAPTFKDEDRKACYKYFKKYIKYVEDYRETNKDVFLFDENDLIFNIHKRLQRYHVERKEHPLNHWYIDSFYIDEVQDFTQAELCVLLGCCRNPNGTFCTGDIAQSIMKGVFFRFEDLRTQFHHLATSSEARLEHVVRVPKLRSLEENFRSHSGVLNLAQSIVDILKNHFQKSFQDSNLPREKAMFKGDKPILLVTKSKDELARILLGNPENTEVPHELGAHQAIIVRSDKARKELPESLRGGLVLTVLEAKGLEFNDVLIYNFFTDSQVKDQWRLLYNDELCEESPKAKEQLGMTKHLHQLRINDKQEERLKSLSAELKHLYTAITRARMNLWIYDESGVDKLPFYYYCLANDLTRLVNTSDENSEDENLIFAAPSPSEQWTKQGDYYFKLRKWDLAMTCYKKGSNLQKKYLAEGYKIFEAAQSAGKSANKLNQIKEAAKMFLLADCSEHSTECIVKAIKCLISANLHNEAAMLLEKMEKYDEALKQWILAKNTKKVVETRERLNDYSGAIRYIAYEMKEYGTALLKAQEYETVGHNLDDDVKPQQIAYMYIRNKKGEDIEMSEAFRLVSDDYAKATLLHETGRLEEAAIHFLKTGHQDRASRILEAQNLFEKGSTLVFSDEKIHAKFLLHHVLDLSIKSDWKRTKDINEILGRLRKSPFFYFHGRSLILAAIVDRNDQLLLTQAIDKFKQCECLPGEILAFCTLKHLFPSKKEPGKDLHYSKAARDVAEAIRAVDDPKAHGISFIRRSIYQEVCKFHDLHSNDGDDYYCISSFLLKNNICPTLKSLDQFNHDEDGMIKLAIKQVNECLTTYYSQLSIDFLTSSAEYYSQLPVKLRTSEFYFMLQSRCIPRKELSLDLNNFFKILKELLEYSDLMKVSYDVCKDTIMFRLFSPDVAHFLHITRSNINYLKRNSVVIKNAMTDIAMKMLNDPECTLQTYFTAFRLLTVFIGKYEAQGRIMSVMESHVHSKYIFSQENTGKKLHIFNGWIETHNRIVRGDITGAVNSAYYFFLKRISNLDDSNKAEAISISSINYIVSILSTALLGILQQGHSARSGYQYFNYVYLVPRYMKLMLLTNFELFCSNPISNACIQQMESSSLQFNLPRLFSSCIKQLNIFLSFLLGDDGCNYDVLQTALTTQCYIQDGSAFYCLIQCLIIASNLYIEAYTTSNHEAVNRVHAQLVKIHKIVRHSVRICKMDNGIVPGFMSSAVESLSKAGNIKDIFKFVHQILPTQKQSQNSDLCTAFISNDSMVYESQYPSVPLRTLVIMERPSDKDQMGVVEQQVISSEDIPSPSEELTQPVFNNETTDNEELELAGVPDGLIVTEDYCSVCEVELFQGVEGSLSDDKQAGAKKPEEYHTHLKSDGHTIRIQEYKEFVEKKDSLQQQLSKLNIEIKALHEQNSLLKVNKLMIDSDKLKTQEQKISDDTMKCLIPWSDGTAKLHECQKQLEELKKLFNELKDEHEKRTMPMPPPKEETVEILPTETEPPKLSKKSRKGTRKRQTK